MVKTCSKALKNPIIRKTERERDRDRDRNRERDRNKERERERERERELDHFNKIKHNTKLKQIQINNYAKIATHLKLEVATWCSVQRMGKNMHGKMYLYQRLECCHWGEPWGYLPGTGAIVWVTLGNTLSREEREAGSMVGSGLAS